MYTNSFFCPFVDHNNSILHLHTDMPIYICMELNNAINKELDQKAKDTTGMDSLSTIDQLIEWHFPPISLGHWLRSKLQKSTLLSNLELLKRTTSESISDYKVYYKHQLNICQDNDLLQFNDNKEMLFLS